MNEQPFAPSQTQLSVPRSRSIVFPVLITLGCTVLLTGGFIVGAFATCNFMSSHPTKWFGFFVWGSIAGLVALVLCVLFIAAWGVWMIVKKIREN